MNSRSVEAIAAALEKLRLDPFFAAPLADTLHDAGFVVSPMGGPMPAEATVSPGRQPYEFTVRARAQLPSNTYFCELFIGERQRADRAFMKDYLPRVLAAGILEPVKRDIEEQISAAINGEGQLFDVYQGFELVGQMPALPAESTSPLYDVRPHDFAMAEKGGKPIIVADRMLGPGDFEAVKGFVRKRPNVG